MPFRVTAMLAALTIAACGAPNPPPANEPTPPASEEVALIEGEESIEYERIAQISMLVFGADARERVVGRARARAAEVGADALSFRLYPVTRPTSSAQPVRQRLSHVYYSLAPLLRARISCSVIERSGEPNPRDERDPLGMTPDCSEFDSSLETRSSLELGQRPAVPLRDRGYILMGWALQHRPESLGRKRSDL